MFGYNNNNSRSECYWYCVIRDMNATIPQCRLAPSYQCPCTEDCKKFITQREADDSLMEMLGIKKERR